MDKTKLKLLWAGRTKYLPNWGIRSHRHDCFQLFYIVSGDCSFCVAGKECRLGPGQFLAVRPGEEHSMQKDHDSVVRMIDIKLEILDARLRRLVQSIARPAQASEQVSYLFKLISYEIGSVGGNNREIIQAYLYVLILKMLPAAGKQTGALIITGIDDSAWTPFCRKIAQYIKEKFSSGLDLEEIAGYMGYNKNYICGIFKKGTGMTIMDYVKMVRIERACELIEMSDYTFQQICMMAGFNSVHNFNKVFKQVMKMTPGQYKLKMNERNAVAQDTFKNEDNYDVI
jgi:AraC-like DNA-binding protein